MPAHLCAERFYTTAIRPRNSNLTLWLILVHLNFCPLLVLRGPQQEILWSRPTGPTWHSYLVRPNIYRIKRSSGIPSNVHWWPVTEWSAMVKHHSMNRQNTCARYELIRVSLYRFYNIDDMYIEYCIYIYMYIYIYTLLYYIYNVIVYKLISN